MSVWLSTTRALDELDAMWREMDDLMRPRGLQGEHGLLWAVRGSRPVQTWSTDDGWTVTLDVPGLSVDDIEVEVHAGRLTVRGEHKPAVPEGFEPVRRERRGWRLDRSFDLPDRADVDAVEARVSDGLLTVHVPRRPEAARRLIPVNA